jgi:hypothetical protein
MKNRIAITLVVTLLGAAGMGFSQSQTPQTQTQPAQSAPGANPYKPKFRGDPARSEAESGALGYMRVVLRAQREYKKRHDKFAETLPDLAGTGTFTKRMARSTDRGDYTVEFHGKKDSFTLAVTPKQFDDQHRAFYAEDDGVIHAEEGKPATAASPKLK